jgi:hypothetical protein
MVLTHRELAKTRRMAMKKCSLLLLVLLTGCFGPGQMTRIPLEMPDGSKATIVAHNQMVPDWMLARDSMKLNFIVRGEVSLEQLQAVASTETACRIYTKTVRPNDLVLVLSSGALYSLAGFVGVGAGSQALQGSPAFLAYGGYGAAATGVAGLANGVITLGGKTYTFENCGREALETIFPQYRIHVLQKSPY